MSAVFSGQNLHSRKLAFYRGRISSVGSSSGSIPKAGSILGVLKELRNEGTSYALQTARSIMVVPSLQRVEKNNVLNWCFRAKYIGTQIKWVFFVCLFVFFARCYQDECLEKMPLDTDLSPFSNQMPHD